MGTAVHIVASISMRHGTQNVVQCPQMDVVADGMTELGEYILSLCERRNLSMRAASMGAGLAAGKMDVDVYQVADADLSAQQAAAQKRMTELDALLADSLSSERRADRLSALSVTIRELIENNDPATVATALQNVGLRAELTNHDGHPHIRVMLV